MCAWEGRSVCEGVEWVGHNQRYWSGGSSVVNTQSQVQLSVWRGGGGGEVGEGGGGGGT